MKNYTAKELFAEWYRKSLKIEITGEDLDVLQESIEKVLKEKDTFFWLDLLAFYSGKRKNNSDSKTIFYDHFKEVNPHFPTTGNDHQIKVLMGCTIAQKIDAADSFLSATLVLGLLCLGFGGKKLEYPVSGLTQFTMEAWVHACHSNREIPNDFVINESLKTKKPVDSFLKDESLVESSNVQVLKDTLSTIYQDLNTIVRRLKKMESLPQSIKILSEECNILWWVFGGYSHDLQKPLSKFESHSVLIQIGKELADLTAIIPGIPSIKSLIHKAISQLGIEPDNKFSITKVIRKTHSKTQSTITDKLDKRILEFLPITQGFNNLQDLDAEEDIQETTILMRTGIKAGCKIEAFEIIFQIYKESMFIKAFNEISG